jgi:hypothetical protein
MEVVIEITKYTLPALLVVLITYLMLSSFLDNEEKRRAYLLRREMKKGSISAKLQAYERVALFLERISPHSLMVRVPAGTLSVSSYQSLLLKTIRNEFEHNLSQQIYISDEVWRQIVHAKSATVGIVNKCASECKENDKGIELSKRILNYEMELEVFPTRKALFYLKSEIQKEI